MADQAKPATTFTDQVKPQTGRPARFGIGMFGVSRFSTLGWKTETAKPTSTFIDQAKP